MAYHGRFIAQCQQGFWLSFKDQLKQPKVPVLCRSQKTIAPEGAYRFFVLKKILFFFIKNKTRQTPLNSLTFVLFIEKSHQLNQGLAMSITGVFFVTVIVFHHELKETKTTNISLVVTDFGFNMFILETEPSTFQSQKLTKVRTKRIQSKSKFHF